MVFLTKLSEAWNDDLERMETEVVMAEVEVLTLHHPGGTEGTKRKPHSGLSVF
jgi:hypothetical protein